MKAISNGSLAGCLVHLDAGSIDCLVQQNLQIPEHAYSRTPTVMSDITQMVQSKKFFDARLAARQADLKSP